MLKDNWTQIPAGRLNAALQRVLVALGNDAERVVFCINTNEHMAQKIAQFAISQIDSGDASSEVALSAEEAVRISVVSDGTTGREWIDILGEENISPQAKEILLSKDFSPTNGVEYTVEILRGAIFSDEGFNVYEVLSVGRRRNLSVVHPEVSCLISRKFSNESLRSMGVTSVVFMQDVSEGLNGNQNLLAIYPVEGSYYRLGTYLGDPGNKCCLRGGFAFLA